MRIKKNNSFNNDLFLFFSRLLNYIVRVIKFNESILIFYLNDNIASYNTFEKTVANFQFKDYNSYFEYITKEKDLFVEICLIILYFSKKDSSNDALLFAVKHFLTLTKYLFCTDVTIDPNIIAIINDNSNHYYLDLYHTLNPDQSQPVSSSSSSDQNPFSSLAGGNGNTRNNSNTSIKLTDFVGQYGFYFSGVNGSELIPLNTIEEFNEIYGPQEEVEEEVEEVETTETTETNTDDAMDAEQKTHTDLNDIGITFSGVNHTHGSIKHKHPNGPTKEHEHTVKGHTISFNVPGNENNINFGSILNTIKNDDIKNEIINKYNNNNNFKSKVNNLIKSEANNKNELIPVIMNLFHDEVEEIENRNNTNNTNNMRTGVSNLNSIHIQPLGVTAGGKHNKSLKKKKRRTKLKNKNKKTKRKTKHISKRSKKKKQKKKNSLKKHKRTRKRKPSKD